MAAKLKSIFGNENVFKIESTKAVIVTMGGSNVKELQEASEKYGVEIPNVKYYVILTEGVYECYYQLEGYGNMDFSFGFPESTLDDENGPFAGDLDGITIEAIVNQMILDNMHWEDILAEYLAEKGIKY